MATMYVSVEVAEKMGQEVLDKAFNEFMEHHYEKNCFLKPKRNMFSMVTVLRKPTIVWKKKGFGVAGTAHSRENKIEMNLNYLTSPDAMRFIKNTMVHELAHIINSYYGGRNHDKQWKYIARLLGDDGERCHDYRTPENKPIKKTYQLKCEKCGKVYDVTAYRYNRYQSYRCRCDKSSKLKQI
jgi:predicted SprT family Zn-dependent metalloprotease